MEIVIFNNNFRKGIEIKRHIFFIITLTIFVCLSGCNSNEQKDGSAKITGADKIGQENENIEKDSNLQNNVSPTSMPSYIKSTENIEKVDAESLSIMKEDTFSYINENGQLMIKSINDQMEKPIISGGYVC